MKVICSKSRHVRRGYGAYLTLRRASWLTCIVGCSSIIYMIISMVCFSTGFRPLGTGEFMAEQNAVHWPEKFEQNFEAVGDGLGSESL